MDKWKIVIFIFLISLSFFTGMIYAELKSEDLTTNETAKESKHLLSELIKLNENEVPSDNCQLFDENNIEIKEHLKVSDFLEDYLDYMLFYQGKNTFSYLECGARGEGLCTFNYGERKSNESSHRILSFSYASDRKEIEPNSFECLDIP
jgi:hypothetical protein